MGLANMQWATAALYNGLGRYEEGLAAAEARGRIPARAMVPPWSYRS